MNLRKPLVGLAILGSTLGGAAIGLSSIGSANAATSTSSTAVAATSDTSATATDSNTPLAPPDGAQAPDGARPGPPPDGSFDPSKGGHTANGITEVVLTGDEATAVTDAAEAAVPDGTVDRVETDAEGAAFEAHVTKADGSHVTVKLNADFSVASIEDGMA